MVSYGATHDWVVAYDKTWDNTPTISGTFAYNVDLNNYRFMSIYVELMYSGNQHSSDTNLYPIPLIINKKFTHSCKGYSRSFTITFTSNTQFELNVNSSGYTKTILTIKVI